MLNKHTLADLVEKEEALVCSDCGSDNIISDPDRGEKTCSDCGLVIQEHAIQTDVTEWRAYSKQEKQARARTGDPAFTPRRLSTAMGYDTKDAQGYALDFIKWAKLRNINNRGTQSTRRNATLERYIRHAVSTLELPAHVARDAIQFSYHIADKGLLKGHSTQGMALASLYLVLRAKRIPRSLDEIASITENQSVSSQWEYDASCQEVSRKKLGKEYRFILNSLNIRLPAQSPNEYLPRMLAELGLGRSFLLAKDLVELLKRAGAQTSKDPLGIAAGVSYVVSILDRTKRTQSSIGKLAHLSEVTIRNRVKDLTNALIAYNQGNYRESGELQSLNERGLSSIVSGQY
ncbi:hypothetical protein COT72_04620 [archaeon CG10_big_fil_rev_8_21_14_0_10_43_11]|nr:MAG: hypothetical protein COT72_04620 [archaeon CG10_big_fil_rev_8_21_14_0_10_43_11]